MPPRAPGSKAAVATSRLQSQLQADAARRNELYAGADSNGDLSPEPELPEAQMTTDQLVRKAATTHQDTTATAQRALKVIENTKQIQAATMSELDDQSKRLKGIDNSLTQMNQDIKYSEKILRYMRRCCFCWMCDGCTGADPEEQLKRKWERDVDKGKTQKATEQKAAEAAGQQGAMSRKGKDKNGASTSDELGNRANTNDPDIRLTEQHASTASAMHAETRKQNEIIDQIAAGMDHLMAGAKGMQDELGAQSKIVDDINNRADSTAVRVKEMNTKSQLRKFQGKS